MERVWSALRAHLSRADAVLLGVGLLGLVLYFALLPAQHPDSAASYALPKAEVAERARAFAAEHGLAVPGGRRREVSLERDVALLDSMQQALGRPRTVRLLKGPAGERLPAYHWQVTWEDDAGEEVATVRLTTDGEAYSFQMEPGRMSASAARPVDRAALAYALRLGAPGALPAPDSTLARLLAFAPSDSLGAQAVAPPALEALAAGQPQYLDSAAVVRLARYHLRQTPLWAYAFGVDSIGISQQAGLEVATVRFWGEAFYGQRPRVDVQVTATGGLLELDTQFNPDDALPAPPSGDVFQDVPADGAVAEEQAAEEEDSITIGIEADTIVGIVTAVLYVVLVLVSLFVFFRRAGARVVDMDSALRDALWGGFFAASVAVMTATESILADIPEFWIAVMVLSIAVVFTGAGGAFLIFLASGAMDSVARAAWPEKLTTLGPVRHGALRNVPVGAALLRGLLAGFVLLGGTTLLLMLLPEAAVSFNETRGSLGSETLVSVFGFALATSGWMGLFLGLTVMLGVGTLLHRWKPSPWVVVPGLALVLTLLQAGVVMVEPLGLYALCVGFSALVLAWTFWHYDFVAFFTAQLLANVFWLTSNGWMIEGSPEGVDAVLAFITAGLVLVLALVGLLSGRAATEVPAYVPAYIKQLAEEERLKRDIEIAHEVQQSFLPRQMPAVEGLDLAAMCLAAQDVGGDYYDFIEIGPGRLAVAIGDVSGKGIQAAFYMTLAKGFLQTLAREDLAPAEVLRRFNALFCANAPRGTFISMIYGVVDVRAGTFTFARAGHNPLICHRSAGAGPGFIQPRGMAVGLTPGPRFDEAMEEVTVALRRGDVLVFYTDGFTEAVNTGGERFGDRRLARLVGAAGRRSAGDILRAVSEEVYVYVESAGRYDDMTMIVLKVDDDLPQAARAEAAEGSVAQLV